MISHRDADRSPPLETITRHGFGRRRPRHGLEMQQGRCPWCNRTMIAYVSVRGPRWHCGCDEPSGGNGNGNGH